MSTGSEQEPTTGTAAGTGFPDTDRPGLSSQEVEQLKAQGLVNVSQDQTSRSLGQIIRDNVFTLFNGIILTAMVVVLLTGQWKDAVFGLVIIINTGIGVATELKAKHTLDGLSILVASDYAVRRDGRNLTVPHDDIVKGTCSGSAPGTRCPPTRRSSTPTAWSWTSPC